MNNFLQDIKNNILIFDGSKGTMLQKMGLAGGECPELWNIEHPEKVKEVYSSYVKAGSNVIQTNTFGANKAILEKFGLQDQVELINRSSVELAKEAAGSSVYVAASIGPTGKLLEPSGSLTFEEAYDVFKEQVIAVTQAEADIINFETITDLNEMRAAILAARENSPLPIIASMSFESNGYTLMGNSPAICALVCESLGVDAMGANCSTGPDDLKKIMEQLHDFSTLPLSVKPNAGLPVCSGDTITYNETPEDFRKSIKDFISNGVMLIGGCCGTTPEHISAIKDELENIGTTALKAQADSKPGSYICSYSKYINSENIDKQKIGFFIEDNNEEIFRNLTNENYEDTVTDRVMQLSGSNYDVVFVDLDLIEDVELLAPTIKTIQAYSRLPLIFKSGSSSSLASVLRVYNGKAGVVVGCDDNVFDIVITAKKYGSTIIDSSII